MTRKRPTKAEMLTTGEVMGLISALRVLEGITNPTPVPPDLRKRYPERYHRSLKIRLAWAMDRIHKDASKRITNIVAGIIIDVAAPKRRGKR